MLVEWTATAMLSFGSVSSTAGASEAAEAVQRSGSEVREHIGTANISGLDRQTLLADLAALASETAIAGWDGYNASPVQRATFLQVRSFIDALPLHIASPTLAADPDGDITLEWYTDTAHVLSISISSRGEMNYAARVGLKRVWGSEPFIDEVPAMLIQMMQDCNPVLLAP